MPTRGRDGRRGIRWTATAACLLALHPLQAAQTPQAAAVDRLPTSRIVSLARGLATRKLDRPDCREVLSDFRDESGVALREVLERKGRTAGEFFASLVFVDGHAVPLCADPLVAAAAAPGSPYIAVCRRTFAHAVSRDPGLAANTLIHEMLHALGLGESPGQPEAPTATAIMKQVVLRCGP